MRHGINWKSGTHVLRYSAYTLLLSTALSSEGFAQQTPDGTSNTHESTLEEIIVTARRREETLQEVPASITVLTADVIQKAGIVNMADVALLVPNLNFRKGFRAGVPDISIRGIATPQDGELPVAVLVDGVQAPSLEFLAQDMLDISSIEVLRGPQGALYGRGAIAGAILINTEEPTNDFQNRALLSYGSGNTFRFVDSLSGPISEGKIWGKFTLSRRTSDGLIDDLGTGVPADWYRQTSGRGELKSQFSDTTTVRLRAAYTEGTEGAAYQSVFANDAIGTFPHPNRQQNGRDKRRVESYSLSVDHDTSAGTLTSISQWASSYSDLLASSLVANNITQHNTVENQAFNQDLRLASANTEPVQWMVGAFYQYRKIDNTLQVFGTPGGPLDGLTFVTREGYGTSKAYAFYSQISVDLSQTINITGALRYDNDDRYDIDRLIPASPVKASFSKLQPQITARYIPNDEFMVYATIGKGFRSGGFNGYGDALAFNLPRLFKPETNTNYELGFKATLLDSHLTANVSVYHMDFKNQQLFLVSSAPPSRNVVNVAKTSLDGGEVELNFRPIDSVSLYGSLGINDATVDDFDGTDRFIGNTTPNTYKYTANVGVQYEAALSPAAQAVLRIDYSKLGDIIYDVSGSPSYGPTNWLNARASVQFGNWSVVLWGRNLTDENQFTVVNPNSSGAGTSTGYLAQPRMVGIEIQHEL